jgi:predicted esterase
MNKYSISTAFILAALLFNACSTSTISRPPFETKAEIIAFFSGSLNGNESIYTGSSPGITWENLANMQAFVWETWREANLHFNEEKLISTESIELARAGKWHLPEHLEPDAIMNYYWGSKGARPDGGYPLFLYLHGSGNPVREWANGLRFAQTFDDAPSIYFVPQIPNTGSWYRWYQQSKQFAWERLLRLAFLDKEINPNKIYFFGISEGGYGSQRLGAFYADYLAGAGPMASGEPLKNAPVENYRNTSFSLLTGALDDGFGRSQLTMYAKEAFSALETKYPGSFIHRIELIPDRGHSIPYGYTTPWLKQFARNSHPKQVSWENFAMHGRYRRGFYNIVVNERSNDDESQRTYYEMKIDGNDISLTVDLVSYETIEWHQTGIEMKFARTYTPATKGKITIYLCPELINPNENVTLTVNGKEVFRGKVQPELRHIVNSCAVFFDPMRLFPAAIEVDLASLRRY